MRIDPLELKVELDRSLEAGAMTEQFAFLAMQVAQGYFASRAAGDLSADQRSVMLSDFCARLVNTWRGGEHKPNKFTWLTLMAKSVCFSRLRSQRRQLAHLRRCVEVVRLLDSVDRVDDGAFMVEVDDDN